MTAGVAVASSAITLTHMHGLSYSADGKKLLIPSHHGIAVYAGGKWSKAAGPRHDYMGFAATAGQLYSSGHPAPGSGLVNPFGLIRSRDGGKTWDKLGLEGESDFHLIAASWNAKAIYVWNPGPNSRMRDPGLYVTLSDGLSWKRAAAAGLDGEPRALAVHPDDPAAVAVATSKGVYLSRDSGDRFAAIAAGSEGLAVYFDLDGKHLWYGAGNGRARLARIPVAGGLPAQVELPPLDHDAVAYIAQNPSRRGEYAIATFDRSVYLSADGGRTWKRIAEHGFGVTAADELLRVSGAWASPTVPGQSVGAAYMELRSKRDADLVKIESDASLAAEIHEMTMTNDVMRMRRLERVELPADQTVELAPGRRHVMLVDLRRPLKVGDQVRLTLTLRLRDGRAASETIVVPVLDKAVHGTHQ